MPHCCCEDVEQPIHVIHELLKPVVRRLCAAHRSRRDLLYLTGRLPNGFHQALERGGMRVQFGIQSTYRVVRRLILGQSTEGRS